MAKLIMGPLVSKISGKIGSVIFSSWKGTAYVKQMPIVIHNPSSEAQALIRNLLISFLMAWKVLNDDIKALWREHAQGLGSGADQNSMIGSEGLIKPSGKVMTGANAFVGTNVRLVQVDMDRVEVPPVSPVPGPTSLSAAMDTNIIEGSVVFPPDSLIVDDVARIFLRVDKPGGHTYLSTFVAVTLLMIGETGIVTVPYSISTIRMGHEGQIEEVGIEHLSDLPVSLQADGVAQTGYKTAASNIVRMVVNPLA